MTIEVVNESEVIMRNHIQRLHNEYPSLQEIIDRIINGEDEDAETLKVRWFVYEHIYFKPHDDVYGICNYCNTPKYVYQPTLTKPYTEVNGNLFINTTELCNQWFCYEHAKYWWQRNYMPYPLQGLSHYEWFPDTMEIRPDEPVDNVDNCGACQGVIANPNWVNYDILSNSYKSVYGIRNTDDASELVPMHTRCTVRCESCDVHYYSWHLSCGYTSSSGSRVSMQMVNGRALCRFCTEEWESNNPDYAHCENDCIVSSENDLIWSDIRECSLCRPCYDVEVECNDCGYNYYEDDGHSCDYDDGDSSYPSSEYVHSYSYKPNPNFFGNSNYYLGIELEVEDKNDNYAEGAEIAFNAMNPSRNKKFRGYLKSDGSLTRGFEIVSHPHTLKEFQDNFPWEMLTKLKQLQFRSWNTTTCGLHVHVSRTAFDDDNHQLRFIKLIYDNERQVSRIAGRTSNYASFSDKGRLIPKVKYKNQSNGRYSAVNVENDATLEVRVFRGSLHIPRVLSAIEFVDSVVQYTKGLKITPKDKPLSWVRYVGFISANSDKYPNLFDIVNRSFSNDTSENVED